MSEIPKVRVLWMTNLPAPYRFPIWDFMAKYVDLEVVFLLKKKNWRNWNEPVGKIWNYSFLSLNSINFFEYDFIPSTRSATKILQDIDVAIIGGWESPMYIRTILSAKKKNLRIFQFYESTSDSHRFSKGPIDFVRKWVIRKADYVITISESSKEAILAMGVPSQKIISLFNPADIQSFYKLSQKFKKTESKGHHYIYVGQLIERKNIANVIRSFAAIRSVNDSMTIAGDGPTSSSLKQLVYSLGLEGSVFFVGHRNQTELAKFFCRSNTLILASTNEVWGLVVNEALASGLHVVVSNKCGVAEFVREMKGVFVCETDQESIQNAMKQSSNSWRGYIKKPEILKFTPEKFADAIIQLIKRSDKYYLK